MVDTAGQQPSTDKQTPSVVFPIPGYSGAISPHGSYNGGSDIMAPTGSPVVSMVSGKVNFVSTQQTAPGSGGNSVEIHGADGKDYYYAHLLNPTGLSVGQSVVAGQSLGQVDTTGNAKGGPSHLHIGIGYGISTGVRTAADPSAGGLGKNFDAVAMLRSLAKDPKANNPALATPGAVPNPPAIHFNPSVPGFDSAHAKDIEINVQRALAAGIDPALWLAIVSKESTFNANARNPSGACGYSQLLPCTTTDPVKNIDAGIAKLKSFLSACNGDTACALDKYSGGGGLDYIKDVNGRAAGILISNPDLPNAVGTDAGDPSQSSSSSTDSGDCPPIKFGAIGPMDINIPNPLCIIGTALRNMVTSLSKWWGDWQREHIPNWTFVILGLILIVIGALALANSAGMQPPTISGPVGAATEEVAPSAEAVAALA